jgi:hypothetical protein
LLLLDLDHVEEAGVAVAREADAVLDRVDLLRDPLEGRDFEQAAPVGQLANGGGDHCLGPAHPIGERFAVELVDVAASLLRLIAREPGDLLPEFFEPVLFAPVGVRCIAHRNPPCSAASGQ